MSHIGLTGAACVGGLPDVKPLLGPMRDGAILAMLEFRVVGLPMRCNLLLKIVGLSSGWT